MTDSDSSPRVPIVLDVFFALWCAALFLHLHGLPLGVGNQSLHLAWLRHLRDPSVMAGDPLLESFHRFPSWFFVVLARSLPPVLSVETALRGLQVLNTAFLFLGVIRLGRAVFPRARWMALAPLFFVFEPTRALAETPLPPIAFSHTSLGLVLSLFGLEAVFRERWRTAAVLFGLLVNIHLLSAAYAGAIAAIFTLVTWPRRPLRRLGLPLLIGAALAAPTLWSIASTSGTEFDDNWRLLLRERSAHHVYPDQWWKIGDPVVGSFLLAMGWLATALALRGRDRKRPEQTLMWAVPLALMLTGGIGVYLFPHPWVLRAQLFRASIYPLLLSSFALAAAGERVWRGDGPPGMRPLALLSAATLVLPSLHGLQPHALAALAVAAWSRGDLRLSHALVAGLVFPLLAASDRLLDTRFLSFDFNQVADPALALAGAGSLLLATALASDTHPFLRAARVPAAVAAMAAGIALLPPPASTPSDTWTDIQIAAQVHTPPDARILTPTRRAGFRDHSRRAIAGEWRDGTMQFFDPAFAEDWARRMRRLAPERTRSFTPRDWVSAGETFQADYAVLPADRARGLVPVAHNRDWALVETRRPPPPPLPDPPENAVDPDTWAEQERYFREVVRPNIERVRVREAVLRLRDPEGRPLAGMAVEIEQTRLAFGVGSALHHFEAVPRRKKGYNAPRVHPRELDLFKEVFNYSIMGYSGKWFLIEPEPGERHYDDLDAYVDWCARNDIPLQYHFVTGYEPEWVKDLSRDKKREALMAHANDLIDRYGDRIDEWQIVNENRLLKLTPEVFDLFRERLPDDRLGISHCARFYTRRKGKKGDRDLKRGWHSIRHVVNAGRDVDFFAVHAHRPFGLWADPRVMYKVLDDLEHKGLRVVISETGVSRAGKIVGDVRTGTWTPELQAEYLTRFMEALYSHPVVDAVNFWGFGHKTWQPHIGLLDKNHEPLPAFYALKQLVRDQWNSRAEGRTRQDGGFPFRGHRGEYRIVLRHPDGRRAEGTFALSEDTRGDLPVTLTWHSPEK